MVVDLFSEGWYVFLARFKLQHVHGRGEKKRAELRREDVELLGVNGCERSWRRRRRERGGKKGWCGDLSCGVGEEGRWVQNKS